MATMQALEAHERASRELAAVAEALLPGTAVADRGLAEALLRIIGVMLRLHEEHAPDGKGRCHICGSRQTCPMRVVTAVYTARPPAGRGGHSERRPVE
jgi:hypothetical protein